MNAYDYVEKIGSGSYGEVSLIKSKKTRKKFVSKKVSLLGSAREREAAKLEVTLLQKLKHPNIVSYHDSFEHGQGQLMIVMAYCEGGDLARYLGKLSGPLDEQLLVEWLVQICMALQYLHQRNILHRDLKTQNIFLTGSHIIKLGDLGIARVLDSASDLATTVIGTPYYMSPELFRNTPYGKQSDVWALGCCTFEMMTKKHAFNARDINSLAAKVLRGKQPKMPDSYSKDLTNLVTRMLAFDEKKRPTVAQILQMRFIRDRIKIFLQKQRPNSGKKTRPVSGGKRPSSGEKKQKPIEQDFDTLKVEVGTIKNDRIIEEPKRDNLSMVSTAKAKEFQMRQFLSKGAQQMIKENLNTTPETYIVQKNVKDAPQNLPVVNDLNSSLARQRRRQKRQQNTNNSENDEFYELLTGTLKPVVEEHEQDEKPSKPGVLAGDQTMSSISRIANRMATLRRQLYNELGNTKLMQAMDAVSLDDEEEMWKRLNKLLPEDNRHVWAARVHTLVLLDRALDAKYN